MTAPDFSDWSPARLAAHLEHLDRLLLASLADPGDPMRAQLRADREAVRALIAGKGETAPEPLNQIARERAYQAAFTAIMTGNNQVAALVLRDLGPESLTELHVICGDVQIMVEADQRRRGATEGSG